MAYSTPAMIRKAIVPTSDGGLPASPTRTAADLSDEQLADAIAEADTIIDSYVGRLYTVPVAPVGGSTPHPIDYWSRNIATYNAVLAFRGSQDISDQDPVVRRYNATMQALQAVGQGTTGLELPRNRTDSSASTASDPINPNIGGDLFGPEDWTQSGPAGYSLPYPVWNGDGWRR